MYSTLQDPFATLLLVLGGLLLYGAFVLFWDILHGEGSKTLHFLLMGLLLISGSACLAIPVYIAYAYTELYQGDTPCKQSTTQAPTTALVRSWET